MVAQALQQLRCSPSAHGCQVASRRPKAGLGGLRAARHGATPLSAVEDGRILDPDGYKQRVGQMWRSRAPSYDFQNDFHPPLCEQLVTLADLKPGKMRILDVASGTGSVALSAARALGPDGAVMAVDISEAMLTQVWPYHAYSVACDFLDILKHMLDVHIVPSKAARARPGRMLSATLLFSMLLQVASSCR